MNAPTETSCCPRFNPEYWDGKEINWSNKLFVKDQVKCLLHIPLNFSKVVVRNMKKLEDSGTKNPDYIMLSDEMSAWKSNLLIAVDKEVPGAQTEKISGKFISKAFEGHYSNAGKWAREMKQFINGKGLNANKLYFWYTTCPKCAKAYGKNYTVIFAQV
ncbi:MAG: hypothetical protein HYY40_12080 [Bacteroidetes bacterium]|nr:hypothetical protein [Bacteroidota bacterium]